MNTTISTTGIGRLALRCEGKDWVAYYAQPATMKGAIRIASIKLRLVENEERKAAFQELMQDVVGDLIHEVTGVRPTWPNAPEPAPEHEKAGHA